LVGYRWYSEEENLRDLAEEALSEHHDEQVKYFYEMERERVAELRKKQIE
jgi:hypothetical protein